MLPGCYEEPGAHINHEHLATPLGMPPGRTATVHLTVTRTTFFYKASPPDGSTGSLITRVAAREKEKAPGPCELRALLRDEPSSPCTRHGRRRITGHRQTLRSDNASYARALDRAHNLSRLRDEIETSDHFKGG